MSDTMEIKDFDDIGVYTIPPDENTRYYSMRKLCEYCKKKGIETNQLTDEEMKMFEIKRNKNNKPAQ